MSGWCMILIIMVSTAVIRLSMKRRGGAGEIGRLGVLGFCVGVHCMRLAFYSCFFAEIGFYTTNNALHSNFCRTLHILDSHCTQ